MSDKTQGEHNRSVFGCLASATRGDGFYEVTICLPIASGTRLKDGPVNVRAAGSGKASGRFTEDISAEGSDPWHRKPHQRGRLKRNAKTECGLIGHDRIMPVLRRPLPDHEPDAVLNRERPAEVQEVQGAVGARGEFPGEVIRYNREA